MEIFNCIRYFVFTGILGFLLGRIIPKDIFHYSHFPYKAFKFEKNGKFYDKFKVHKWQNKVPDMSRILPRIMPAKNLKGNYKDNLPLMLEETCVAEFIHFILCITGLYSIKICEGFNGFIIWVLYVTVFNLPYIIIQRYNRPRLIRLYERIKRQSEYIGDEVTTKCEC